MANHDSDEWEYALWSSLSLEFLARAALANVDPTLLVDSSNNWQGIYHALGHTPNDPKFRPKSIGVSEVFRRLTAIHDSFTREHESFCISHTERRNTELHTGEAAFDDVPSSTWQPRFYQCCEVLLASMGMSLEDFVGRDEAKAAKKQIAASQDESAKAIKGDVEAHRKVWSKKPKLEREKLVAQSGVWAARHDGHRVSCPSCASTALVSGEPVAPPTTKLVGDEIKVTQKYLPSQFECVACGLKINGLSRLAVVGLGERYKKTETFDAVEYYAPPDEYEGYEDDNNER